MLCPACRQGAEPQPSRKGEQLCSRCGQLLAPDHMMRRVRDKLLQLARFGLDATRGALLERKPRKE